jgi:BASS family bile acid:Na+ symporter
VKWLDDAMPLVSMAGIAFIIVIITAAGRDSLLTIGPALLLIRTDPQPFGLYIGLLVGQIVQNE